MLAFRNWLLRKTTVKTARPYLDDAIATESFDLLLTEDGYALLPS